MKTKRKPNWPLLRQIMKDIAAEPLRLDMRVPVFTADSVAPCRTAACIAGFALLNREMVRRKLDWVAAGLAVHIQMPQSVHLANWVKAGPRAQRLLGLNAAQRDRLFHVYGWPTRYKDQYKDAIHREEASRIAVNRLRHFIKTRGRE